MDGGQSIETRKLSTESRWMEESLHRLENPRQRADGWRSVYRDKKTLDSSKKKKKEQLLHAATEGF